MRLPDWEQRLHAFACEHRATAYSWGEHDCLLFTAKAVTALTGKDHAKKHRGKYRSFASAYAYLKKLGHDSPESFLDGLFDEKPVGFAGRGDIVLCRTDTADVPGVCMGAFALVAGEEGTIRVARTLWLKAWAI